AYLAACLHRTGNDNLAAEMLLAAQISATETAKATTAPASRPVVADAPKSVAQLAAPEGPIPRHQSAWHWYSSAVHAYMVPADTEALFYLRRMGEFQPDAMKPLIKEKAKDEDRSE